MLVVVAEVWTSNLSEQHWKGLTDFEGYFILYSLNKNSVNILYNVTFLMIIHHNFERTCKI
jgi:hypothetical protein